MKKKRILKLNSYKFARITVWGWVLGMRQEGKGHNCKMSSQLSSRVKKKKPNNKPDTKTHHHLQNTPDNPQLSFTVIL